MSNLTRGALHLLMELLDRSHIATFIHHIDNSRVDLVVSTLLPIFLVELDAMEGVDLRDLVAGRCHAVTNLGEVFHAALPRVETTI